MRLVLYIFADTIVDSNIYDVKNTRYFILLPHQNEVEYTPKNVLILAWNASESFGGRAAGGAYNAPPDPLAGLRGRFAAGE